MVDRRIMEKHAAAQIGLRMKAARVLTNLNQEGFADKFSFGYASVKNWELGRSIPREETIFKILEALKDCGVQTTRDWLLFGIGSGPIHLSAGDHDDGDLSALKPDLADFSGEIAQFERFCMRSSYRPVITKMRDDVMAPFFGSGDVIGGVLVNITDFPKSSSEAANFNYPFLVEMALNDFQPRLLGRDAEGTIRFWRTSKTDTVGDLIQCAIGKIVWVRKML